VSLETMLRLIWTQTRKRLRSKVDIKVITREKIRRRKEKRRKSRRYNSKVNPRAFYQGDLVWQMHNNARKMKGSSQSIGRDLFGSRTKPKMEFTG